MEMDFENRKSRILISLLVILTTFSLYLVKYFFKYVVFKGDQYSELSWELRSSLVIFTGLLLCFVAVAFLSKFSFAKSKQMLGFDKGFKIPFIIAIISNLPSIIGYAFLNGYQFPNFSDVFYKSLLAGFNEEIVYRAFLIGILVRYCHWNFWVAVMLSACMFAYVHLYQATSLTEGVKIFLFTSGAGIGFALFYKFWDWNIWFPILMHVLMNLSFVLFVNQGNVLMNGKENIFRFLSLIIAISVTIYICIKGKRTPSEHASSV